MRKYFFNRWALLAAFCIFAAIGAYLSKDNGRWLENIYYSCSMWLIAYTALITGNDFLQSVKIRHTDRKMEYSIKLVEDFDSDYLRVARDLTRDLKNSHEAGEIAPKDLINKIEDDKELKRSIIYLFNYWERINTAFKYDLADNKYIKEHLGAVYVDQFDRFKPWLNTKKDSASNLYDNLAVLNDRWKK